MSMRQRISVAVLALVALLFAGVVGYSLHTYSAPVNHTAGSSTVIPRTTIGLSHNRGPSGYPVVTSPSTKTPAPTQTAVSSAPGTAPAHQVASTTVNASSAPSSPDPISSIPSSLPTSGAGADPQQPIPTPTGSARATNTPTGVPVPTSPAPSPSEPVSVAPTTPAPTQTTPTVEPTSPTATPTTPDPSPTETTPTAVPTTPSPTQTTPTVPAPEPICAPFAQQTMEFLDVLGNGQNNGEVVPAITYYQNQLQLDIHSIYLSDPASPVYGDLLSLSTIVSGFKTGGSLSSLTSSIATVEGDCS